MKSLKHILKSVLLVVIISSCNTDFLDTEPLDKLSEVAVWGDPVMVETYVNNIYYYMSSPYDIDNIASYVDEAHFTPDWGVSDFNKCLITPDDIPGWSISWFGKNTLYKLWGDVYSRVRMVNIFFAHIDDTPFNDDIIDGVTLKDRLLGEVHFQRAYFYHSLVSLYGGVPIITEPYVTSDDFSIARNTYEECINFIVDDLDNAISLLPIGNTGANAGRATKGAAMALKARVLLYAASDLHNNNSLFSGYSNPELLGYTSGDATERWTKAKNAAKAVINAGTYSLYMSNPASVEEAKENIISLFIAKDTEEDIFKRAFRKDSDLGWDGNNVGMFNGPNGWHGWGNNCPLENLVESYEFNNGVAFDWDNQEHAADPYVNRDPRFYASILYEGAYWRPRPEDIMPMDPVGIYQAGSWELPDGTIKWGLDSRKSLFESWNGSYTGYSSRKFIDPEVDSQFERQDVPWRYIRYAEILLNYAEACIELGEEAEARAAINQVRKRAGMPDIDDTGDALKARYRNERRVELSYEEQRFYDVRRWVIGHEAYVPAKGVNIVYKLIDGVTAEKPTVTPITIESWQWDDKAYFFPIYRSEMNKNDLLVQNPGY